jgi:hypothetical protein
MAIDSLRTVNERDDDGAPPERTLLEELELQARDEGLSDRALALACGIDQAMLVHVRRGVKRFGPEACARIVRRYPHLHAAAARHLADLYGRPALRLLAEASHVAHARSEGTEGPTRRNRR